MALTCASSKQATISAKSVLLRLSETSSYPSLQLAGEFRNYLQLMDMLPVAYLSFADIIVVILYIVGSWQILLALHLLNAHKAAYE